MTFNINNLLEILQLPEGTPYENMESALLDKDEISTDLPGTIYFDKEYFEAHNPEFFTCSYIVIPSSAEYSVLTDDDKIVMITTTEGTEVESKQQEIVNEILTNAPMDVTVNEVTGHPVEPLNDDDLPDDLNPDLLIKAEEKVKKKVHTIGEQQPLIIVS